MERLLVLRLESVGVVAEALLNGVPLARTSAARRVVTLPIHEYTKAGGNDLELDEVGTKLDLARAYVEMGDKEGAREILAEVLAEGSESQKTDPKGLMSSLG